MLRRAGARARHRGFRSSCDSLAWMNLTTPDTLPSLPLSPYLLVKSIIFTCFKKSFITTQIILLNKTSTRNKKHKSVDVKAAVGDVVRFKPEIPAGSSIKDSSITWKYTRGGDVIKVIEWDNDFKTLEKLNPKFKRCVDLDMTTGELTIRDLQLDHTGLYTIEIDNKEQYKRYTLTVKESVPTPTLKQEKTSNDVMNLTCEYNAMIRWACSDGEKPQTTKLAKPRQGEFITFTRAENPDVCCTCTLFNDVSEKTSNQICVKDLFHGLSTAVIIVIVIIGILLICILVFLCWRSYYKRRMIEKRAFHHFFISSFFSSQRDS